MTRRDPSGPARPDPLEDKPELFSRRQAIWRHNALLGQARRAQLFMVEVQQLETTSPTSKYIARTLIRVLDLLEESLHRRCPDWDQEHPSSREAPKP